MRRRVVKFVLEIGFKGYSGRLRGWFLFCVVFLGVRGCSLVVLLRVGSFGIVVLVVLVLGFGYL